MLVKKGRELRKRRVRAKISGTKTRPRISVFRSNKFVYVQAIDDEQAITLAHVKHANPVEAAKGLAKKLIKKKIKEAVFDRSGYKFHGKIKLVADNLRKKGINI